MFVLSQIPDTGSQAAMLHSLTVDPLSRDIYLTKLPGDTPPLKFFPALPPPVRNPSTCTDHPPQWPEEWNATLLLTPYDNGSSLVTAEVQYSAQERAMYVQLDVHESKLRTLYC